MGYILSFSSNPYKSVDPAPPSLSLDTDTLQNTLLDESRPLFDRYRYTNMYRDVFIVDILLINMNYNNYIILLKKKNIAKSK